MKSQWNSELLEFYLTFPITEFTQLMPCKNQIEWDLTILLGFIPYDENKFSHCQMVSSVWMSENSYIPIGNQILVNKNKKEFFEFKQRISILNKNLGRNYAK